VNLNFIYISSILTPAIFSSICALVLCTLATD